MEDEKRVATARRLVIGIVLVVIAFLGYQVILKISRIGEQPVLIKAAPKQSLIFINDEPAKQGTAYLGEGKYTITARLSGFTDDQKNISVSNKPVEVYLLPQANSPKAKQFLSEDPDAQNDIQKVYDGASRVKSQDLTSKDPIIKLLPNINIEGGFSIDYGPSTKDKNRSVLIISDAEVEGRANALKWIRQQGYDPTDYEIQFSDFINPITDGPQ